MNRDKESIDYLKLLPDERLTGNEEDEVRNVQEPPDPDADNADFQAVSDWWAEMLGKHSI